ncbi:MAG: CHASE4 domain-containing protein [Anaerolineae bacterium]
MTLRQKTLLIIGVIFALLVGVLSLLTRTILFNSYEDLQAQNTRANIQRAINSLQRETDNFAGSVDDYARWDDTLNFIQTLDENYIIDNIGSATFTTFYIDYMIFTDPSGQVVYSSGLDLSTETEIPVPAHVLDYVAQHPALYQFASVDDETSGFAHLPEGAAIIASHPIRDSLNQGPIGGALIWVRVMDDADRQMLAEIIQLSIDWYSLDDPQMPADFRTALEHINPSTPTYVNMLDSQRSAGYGLLNDLDGSPVMIVRIDAPSSSVQKGEQTALYFVIVLFILGATAVIATLLLLERLVLARIATFSADVRRISQTNVSGRVTISGKDELGTLEADVNRMLAQIESAQNDLRTAKDAAELANRAKSTFLANMSHELRTPLNAIMGFLSIMMMNGKLDSKDAFRAQRAYANSERLLNTINDILDISRIEAGRLQIVPAPVSIRDVVESIRGQMEVLAEEKQLAINVNIAPNVPAVVETDGDALTKIITNLLSNAIKFTEKGSVSLSVENQDRQLIIKVRDTGIGIAPHMYDLIFESFRQVDESTTRAYGGIGLGLAIVQNLCKAMHGSVRVESELGKGSTFIVNLPLQPVSMEVA